MFDKRAIFRSLKYQLVESLQERNPKRRCELPKHMCPQSKGEVWLVWTFPVSFSEQLPNLDAPDPRAYLFEYDSNNSTVLESLSSIPKKAKGKYRIFVIYLNLDIFPDPYGGLGAEEWIIEMERVKIAVAHEIHYINRHFTLHEIHEAKEYEALNKEEFRTPVTFYDYNLLCSIKTVCSIIASVENANHTVNKLFTTEEDFLKWRRHDESQRPLWTKLVEKLHKRYISWYLAERLLAPTVGLLAQFCGGVPRKENGKVDMGIVKDLEGQLDTRAHSGGA